MGMAKLINGRPIRPVVKSFIICILLFLEQLTFNNKSQLIFVAQEVG